MKKIIFLCIAMSLAIVGSAYAGSKTVSGYSLDNFEKKVETADMGITLNGNQLVLTNVRIVPKGSNPNHNSWLATKVRIESGMADKELGKSVIVNAAVKNGGEVVIPLLAFGKKFEQPVVEKFYGKGDAPGHNDLPIRLSVDNPWVCYDLNSDGSPDLQTLYIGVVSYPDGTFKRLKTVLKNKGMKNFEVPQGILALN